MVHFIGKDNIVFHCIVFPCMLKAYGDGYILPDNVPANEFLNLEGDKLSTSRNWAIWLHEYLRDFPGKQFVNRAVVLTHKYFDGKVPADLKPEPIDSETLAQVPAIKAAITDALEHYRFREALKEAMNLARLGNKYLTDTEPWKVAKTDMGRTASILNVSLKLCADLAIAFAPFIPFSSDKLLSILGLPKEILKWDNLGRDDLLPAGHQLNKAELLFEKIEDEAIDKQLARLDAIREANRMAAAAAAPVEPQKPECTFDEFGKMDIRTATVLEAERVPKTDKLLKLTIDTGIDKRVIVSGILAPRKIRGIESKGMILMAKQPDGKMRIVSPEETLKNGATIG